MRTEIKPALAWWFELTMLILCCAQAGAQTRNVCLDCHARLQGTLRVTLEENAASVHAHKGMSCDTCHGGDTQSESRAKSAAAKFRGHIGREQINDICGGCHADRDHIRRINASLRTDQLAKYLTSAHGMRFVRGDHRAAVCTDCHGVHDIRPASDRLSRVHPLNVARTCQSCHADAEYMKSYGIKISQGSEYLNSVHHRAMLEGDLSAPTCSTCHSSHGNVPEGVTALSSVCSTCHVLQAKFFAESPHKEVFAQGCPTCHSSHGIQAPTDEFVGLTSGAACSACHSADDEGGQAAVAIHQHLSRLASDIVQSRNLLERAERFRMDVSDAQTELKEASESLAQARINVHSARLPQVDEHVEAGEKVIAKVRAAGEAAVAEHNYRRRALALPLLAILAVVSSLMVYIRKLEQDEDQ